MSSVTTPLSGSTFVLSLILLVVGCGILYFLGLILFSAFYSAFGGFFERTTFRRYSLRCAQGDQLLEKGDFAGAVQLFNAAFFLKPVRSDSTLLSNIANYHTGLLSRLLTVADEMGKGRARLPSLAEADRLLAERLEIQLDYFRARKDEDEERVRAAERRLRENERQVRLAINGLIGEIRASSEERVLYH